MKTAEREATESRRFRRVEKICEEPGPDGLFGSVRHVLSNAVSALESRVELFTVELKEFRSRAVSVVLWGMCLLFLGVLTLVAVMGVVVFALWKNALPVLIGFSAFFIIAAIGSFFAARTQLGKIPFGDTVEQLRKDRDAILKNGDDDEDWRREGDSNPR